MKNKLIQLIVAVVLCLQTATADSVTTKDGSSLKGTITLIDKGVIHLNTPYAGKLKLKQEDIVSLQTDNPLYVRLNSGIVIPGVIMPAKDNKLSITAENTIVNSTTSEIKAGWELDKIDPEIDRSRRKWKNEFAFNLNGRTGNIERFNLGTELDFRLKGPSDELYFNFEYEQGEENNNKTEDRALGRISYEQFGKKKLGWFIISTIETDPINDVYMRTTTSSGAAYRLINTDNQQLVIRNGLGYRYTDFETDGAEIESTGTVDVSLLHTLRFKDWFYVENELSHSPALDHFKNYNSAHESSIRIPLGGGESFWIRMGVRNEYESETSANERLDTNYFTQLFYSWK